MTRHLQRLITILLAGMFLAPGWFPLSVLGVEGTAMTRADHGCACGKLTGCCCELFAPGHRARGGEACQLRGRKGGDEDARHAGHGGPSAHAEHGSHHDVPHATHAAHQDPDPGIQHSAPEDDSATGAFCATPLGSRDAPVERAATLDFRTLVGPLLASTPLLSLIPDGTLNLPTDRTPASLDRAPETPPPRPFFVAA